MYFCAAAKSNASKLSIWKQEVKVNGGTITPYFLLPSRYGL